MMNKINETKFREDFNRYKNNLLNTFPEKTVTLMMNSYCMGYTELTNHLNEELGSFVSVDCVLDKIFELGPKVKSIINDVNEKEEIQEVEGIIKDVKIQVDIIRQSGVGDGEWNITRTYAVIGNNKILLGEGKVDLVF